MIVFIYYVLMKIEHKLRRSKRAEYCFKQNKHSWILVQCDRHVIRIPN